MDTVGQIIISLGKIIATPQSTHWVDGKGFSFMDYNVSVIIDADNKATVEVTNAIRLAASRAKVGDFSMYPGLPGNPNGFGIFQLLNIDGMEEFSKCTDGIIGFVLSEMDGRSILILDPMQKVNSNRWDPHKKFERKSFAIDNYTDIGRYIFEVWRDLLENQ